MSKNQLNKDEIKCFILKLKCKNDKEEFGICKDSVDKYLNIILNKIEEFRY